MNKAHMLSRNKNISVDFLLDEVHQLGADHVDIFFVESESLSISTRLGKVDHIEQSQHKELGLRVFKNDQKAICSTNDLSPQSLRALAEEALQLARFSPKDPQSLLLDNATQNLPSGLDLCDNKKPDLDLLQRIAETAEETALKYKEITNSQGATASCYNKQITFIASNGFQGTYQTSGYSLSLAVIAEKNDEKQRDYAYSSVRCWDDLKAPEKIGFEAAERTIKRLSPRKIKTIKASVLLEPRVAKSLLSSFAEAINAQSIVRGTSFLAKFLGTQIFNPQISILDDPLRPRGLRSYPFDAEGIIPEKRLIVDKGVLQTWLLDLKTGRQLGFGTTGHAARNPGSSPHPSPSNLYIEKGQQSPLDLMKDIDQGFLVTDLMGMGINLVTGDYSQGASGFWIEKGEIAYPVSEVTIAGRLPDMFKQMIPCNDLNFHYGIDSPTLFIEEMTIAGTS